MLLDTTVVNVGEDNAIYIELHSSDTPKSELRYGDVKYNEKQQMVVWYGDDNPDFAGWQLSPFGNVGYSAVLLSQVSAKDLDSGNYPVYRVLNNDINFNEKEYLANLKSLAESNDEQ